MTFDSMEVETTVTCTTRAPDKKWRDFVLSTINEFHLKAARYNKIWKHVYGVTYMTEDGQQSHTCSHACSRWVIRSDGLKFCAISGLNIDKLIQQRHKQLKQQNSLKQNEDHFAGIDFKRTRNPNLESPTRGFGIDCQSWPQTQVGFLEKKICRNAQGALKIAEHQRILHDEMEMDQQTPKTYALSQVDDALEVQNKVQTEAPLVKPIGAYPGPQRTMSTATYCAASSDYDEASYGAGSHHDALMV